MEDLVIRNRKITAKDLPIIQAVVTEHWNKGRIHISRELCKHWNWVQPSGRLKDMAFAGVVPLACIGWGSAAWAVKSREQFACDLWLSDGQSRLKTNVFII